MQTAPAFFSHHDSLNFTAVRHDGEESVGVSFGAEGPAFVVRMVVKFDGREYVLKSTHRFFEETSDCEIEADHSILGVDTVADYGEMMHNIVSHFRHVMQFVALQTAMSIGTLRDAVTKAK